MKEKKRLLLKFWPRAEDEAKAQQYGIPSLTAFAEAINTPGTEEYKRYQKWKAMMDTLYGGKKGG